MLSLHKVAGVPRGGTRADLAAVDANAFGRGRTILNHVDWRRVGAKLNLSARQLELVQHIFDGKRLQTIALDMGLSLGTVKTYSQRVHQKLGVSDRLELTLAVVSAHLQALRTAR